MLVNLVVNAIAFYVVAYLIPGVEITGWEALLVVAVVWGYCRWFICCFLRKRGRNKVFLRLER